MGSFIYHLGQSPLPPLRTVEGTDVAVQLGVAPVNMIEQQYIIHLAEAYKRGYKIRYKENGKVIIVVIMGGKIFLPIIIL